MIVTPVRREGDILSTSAENSEGEQKVDDAGSTIQSSGQNVVVLDEPVRPVSSEVELCEKSNAVVHEESAVGTVRQRSEGCADDGGVPVVEAELGVELMDDPEGDRSGAADHESEGDPLISGAKTE